MSNPRREHHPEAGIFGPKRSVRDLVEKRPPLLRLIVVVVAAVIVSAVSVRALAGSGDDAIDSAGVSEQTTPPPSTSLQPSQDGTSTTSPSVTTAPTTVPTTETPAAAPATTEAPAVPVSRSFPTADTTGVPGGTSLTPSESITVTEDGKVIDGLEIEGMVTIAAPNVTIRNSRIMTDSVMGVKVESGGSVVIEDSEIVGLSGECANGVGYAHYVLRRVDVSGCQDGMKASGGSAEIYDSYIHDLRKTDDSHNDSIQSTGATGVVIEGNTICAPYKATVAAINLSPQRTSITDVTIRSNFLYGGNHTVYLAKHPKSDLGPPTNVLYQDNVVDPTAYKWSPMILDSHPTQTIADAVEARAQDIFGFDPCGG